MRRIKAPIALSVRIDALILIDARNIFMGRPSLRVRAGGGGEGGRVESIFNLSRVVAPLINGADSTSRMGKLHVSRHASAREK